MVDPMPPREAIGPDEVFIDSLHVARPIDGGADVFRQFMAPIEVLTDSGSTEIGQVTGWIGWAMFGEDWFSAADAISADASLLGGAAESIIESLAEEPEHGLLVDLILIKPSYRGNGLSGAIIDQLHELLRLEPSATLTLLYPEPQRPRGGPMADGAARDAALARLEAAYRTSGFEPWQRTGVWWRPIG